MEYKKLVKILTKDIAELEGLIAEMKAKKHFNLLEMEFVHTRVKGILHLMQLLDAHNESELPAEVAEQVIGEISKSIERESGSSSGTGKTDANDSIDDRGDKEQPLPGIIPEPDEKKEEPAEPKETPLPGIIPEPTEKPEDEKKEKAVDETPAVSEDHVGDDLVLEEVNERAETGSRLGDSFLKSRSVNDLIAGKVQLEYKLSNRPVPTIQSAIGINDRFQYIRELFDGDNKKYLETIKMLDSMSNIQQAVEYLRANFKWRKNETSLKFVDLVKRRFLNDLSPK